MPEAGPAGPFPILGVDMPTWLVRFDKRGTCTSPGTQAALLQHIEETRYSDVLLYSHGWNTDFPDAVEQYSRFLQTFEAIVRDYPVDAFRPLFVGVTWPSSWMVKARGPIMAATPANRPEEKAEEEALEEIAAQLTDAARVRLYALTNQAALTSEDGLELASLVSPLLGRRFEDLTQADAAPHTPEDTLRLAWAMAAAERGATVDDDDLSGTVLADDHPAGGTRSSIPGVAGAIDPRGFLRLFSLYQMKDRAGRVGSTGVSHLLNQFLELRAAPRLRVFGHSFGAKVVLSAICAGPALARKVDSLLLLQPAISHLAFAASVPGRTGSGGYAGALERVEDPILTTYSALDRPLHDIFHLGLRRSADLGELKIAIAGGTAGDPPDRYAALGGYGPRGSGERLLAPIPSVGTPYPAFDGAGLVGLDGSDRRINDHGDVANGYTAWALRRLVAGR